MRVFKAKYFNSWAKDQGLSDITNKELVALQMAAKEFLIMTSKQLDKAVNESKFFEVIEDE